MPRASDAAVAERTEIVPAILRDHPGGLGRDAIAQEYERRSGAPINWRTLLRRLEGLKEDGRVSPKGRGPGRTYNVAASHAPAHSATGNRERRRETSTEERAQSEEDIPLSQGGAEVRALIRQPFSKRPPVSYQEEFLRE